MKTRDLRTRERWRRWLAGHHDSESEVWLVFHKPQSRRVSMSYEDAVEEALCFGWIDSIVRRLDEARYVRKFTPRKPDSRWSTANRQRYARLLARGALAPAGLARAPTGRSGDQPRPRSSEVPKYIEEALRSKGAAWHGFERLAPSQRRLYVGWIDSAKRQETKERRLHEAARLLAAGKKLGLR